MATRPKVRAFLLCDAAVTDRGSGKITLVGVFDEIVAPAYPAACGQVAVYFKVTDLNGTYEFEVVVLAPDLTTVVGRVPLPPGTTVADPLRSFEGTGTLSRLDLPVAGRYAVRLLYNGLVADEFSIAASEQP
jgi:hypothetical protein